MSNPILRAALIVTMTFVGAAADPALAGNVVSADFNGDLRLDSARITSNGIDVDIDSQIRSFAGDAHDLQTADVDGDGRIDLVIDRGARILLNKKILAAFADATENPKGVGVGPFNPVWSSSATTLENATRHIIGDFDGDGKLELITADYNGPTGSDVATLRVFENTADNTWTEVWSFSDGPRIWNGFAIADTDGDGKVELIAGKIGGSYLGGPFVGPRIYIFESDADNHMVLDHTIEVDPTVGPFTLLDDIAVGDANGDGKLDIAAGLADNETLQTSTWGTRVRAFTYNSVTNQYDMIANHTQTNTGIGYLTAIDIGDSDHDGFGEIIFFERIVPNIYRLEWNGASFAIKSNPSGIPAGVCSDVMCIDADGDGQVDLLAGGAVGAGGNVLVFKSGANDSYTNAFMSTAPIGNTVLYVAADKTISPPLLAGSAHSCDVVVLQYNTGSGTYDTKDFFNVPTGAQLHEITIGHLDADCGLDLMITNFTGSFSSGIYEQRETTPAVGDVTCDMVVNIDDLVAVITHWGTCVYPCAADVNGDGTVNIDDLVLVITHWG